MRPFHLSLLTPEALVHSALEAIRGPLVGETLEKVENVLAELVGRVRELEMEITTGRHIGHGIRGR